MAEQRNLTPFYVAVGVVAVAGGLWIWSSRAGTTTITLPPAGSTPAFAGYVAGSDSALVEIIEYADFQCPACASFAILTGDDVRRRLVNAGRVRWRFKDFPLPIHDRAPLAHLAAACAGEQDQFWAMHDQLFFNQGRWVRDGRPARLFEDYARAIGIDLDRYNACMDEQRYASRIAATRDEGVSLGVNSTPTFIVGDQMISGSLSFDRLAELVAQAEARARR
jgi:protein-disulfide isomerase